MDTPNLPAVVEVVEALPVTVAIGNLGERLYFDADPLDGTVTVTADYGTDVQMDAEDFSLVAELMLRAVGAI